MQPARTFRLRGTLDGGLGQVDVDDVHGPPRDVPPDQRQGGYHACHRQRSALPLTTASLLPWLMEGIAGVPTGDAV
eukprot:3227041-Rhodomonas_salina.1